MQAHSHIDHHYLLTGSPVLTMGAEATRDDHTFMTFADLTIDHARKRLLICTMSYQRLKAVLDLLKTSGAVTSLTDGVLDSEDGGVAIRKAASPIVKEEDWDHMAGEASVGVTYRQPAPYREQVEVKKSAEKLIQTLASKCENCGSAPEVRKKLRKCERCQMVSYCGRECQVAHWKEHKPRCHKQAAS